MSVTSQRVVAAMGAGITSLAGPLLPPWLEGVTSELEAARYLLEPLPGRPGTPLSDLASTPYPAWLGQAGGAHVPATTAPEVARAQLLARRLATRGRPPAIIAAVRAALGNPTATVKLTERDGSAYRFTVTTYTAQTPDPSVVPPAIASEKPVGITFTHVVADGVTWSELEREPEAATVTWSSETTWEQLGLLVPDET